MEELYIPLLFHDIIDDFYISQENPNLNQNKDILGHRFSLPRNLYASRNLTD